MMYIFRVYIHYTGEKTIIFIASAAHATIPINVYYCLMYRKLSRL